MYWLDGSSKLPFVPRCSHLMSSSRAKKFALAQDLIENQAQVVKICVKIGDFDHWCHAASELVDLMIDLSGGMKNISVEMACRHKTKVSTEFQICEFSLFFGV